MKFKSKLVLIFGASVLSFGGPIASAEAKALQCTTVECACETALESNTVEALEAFLKDYQHDASAENTACGALAVPDESEGVESRKAEFDSSPQRPDVSAE
jgi:hypothetical protein